MISHIIDETVRRDESSPSRDGSGAGFAFKYRRIPSRRLRDDWEG
jgi:hypothetical protein